MILFQVDWKLFGRRPPSGAEEWETEFDKYKESPEFKLKNPDISLEHFKFIWYAWRHHHSSYWQHNQDPDFCCCYPQAHGVRPPHVGQGHRRLLLRPRRHHVGEELHPGAAQAEDRRAGGTPGRARLAR